MACSCRHNPWLYFWVREEYLLHMPRPWTEQELLVAMNLYCALPFGQFNHANKRIREVAAQMDRTPSSLSMKLCNLASLDKYHRDRGVAGLRGASNLDRQMWASFQADWSGMAEKSESAFEAMMKQGQPKEGDGLLVLPDGPSEVPRTVKTRRLQTFFRNTVLANYEYQCAISGVEVPELLIASHIIPWSEDESRRADPTNGLCLNVLYDKAFDCHLITFDAEFRLVVCQALKKRDIPEFQRVNFVAIEGNKLRMPHRFAPDEKALAKHREHFRA